MILDFKKNTEFDKIFIDTSYVFDVIFWVNTEWIKDIKGQKHHLRNIVATQFNNNERIYISLNIANDEYDCQAHQEPTEFFENGSIIKQEILNFIKKHIDEIKYTRNKI